MEDRTTNAKKIKRKEEQNYNMCKEDDNAGEAEHGY